VERTTHVICDYLVSIRVDPATFQIHILISANSEVLNFLVDQHLSSDIQAERSHRFKLPLVGTATLSPSRISA
jgi:hypothetical protein